MGLWNNQNYSQTCFSPYGFQSGMKLLSSTSKIIFKGFRREYVWKNYVKLARQESKPWTFRNENWWLILLIFCCCSCVLVHFGTCQFICRLIKILKRSSLRWFRTVIDDVALKILQRQGASWVSLSCFHSSTQLPWSDYVFSRFRQRKKQSKRQEDYVLLKLGHNCFYSFFSSNRTRFPPDV